MESGQNILGSLRGMFTGSAKSHATQRGEPGGVTEFVQGEIKGKDYYRKELKQKKTVSLGCI